MKKTYSYATVDKCIVEACRDLRLSPEEINYEIVENKQGIFIKKATIIVEIDEETKKPEKDKTYETKVASTVNNIDDTDNVEEDHEEEKIDENKGTVSVVNGKLIVKNPRDNGNPAQVYGNKNVKLLLDGQQINGKTAIFQSNHLEVIFEENTAIRNLNIRISEDNMEAYISIKYSPQIVYGLEDCDEKNILEIKPKIINKINPPQYTEEEIKEELMKRGVVYGLINENINQCVKGNCIDVLVAKGKPVIDGTNDEIDVKFSTSEDEIKLEEDKTGNVDFKSIGSIESVKPGDIIAARVPGLKGSSGKDIRGAMKRHKEGKKLLLKVGQGAFLKDENTAAAAIQGKPCIKSNVFYVYEVHEVKQDVSIETGNIKFVGDVIVQGSVKEGMKVEAGNAVDIKKDVERAEIISKGNLQIGGNIIASNIYAGGEDIIRLKVVEGLEEMERTLKKLITAVQEIKRFNILGEDKKDGEIIKILIENKFKDLNKLCIKLIANINIHKQDKEDKLIKLMREKLLGISPINIKSYNELYSIIDVIEEKKSYYGENLAIPVNVIINYCQDSFIQSTGDVYINGKGQYISNISAHNGIYFTKEGSVARGGHIRAKNRIKCKEVGSESGVATKLEVSETGDIFVDVAYQNTVFIVGKSEYILEIPSKNVHAYLSKKGELFVDKLIL